MRYTIFFFLLLMGMEAKAQTTCSMEKVEKQWQGKTIAVAAGGESPDVVQLLDAFQKTWPVGIVSEVMGYAAEPSFTHYAVDEAIDDTGYEIIVDRRNGFVSAGGEGDGDYMEACLWRRDNGHRLFAVRLGKPMDPEIEFVCFYDYDPVRSILKPDQAQTALFQPSMRNAHLSFSLPRQGKDMEMREYFEGWGVNALVHHFSWNGQGHDFAFSSIEESEGVDLLKAYDEEREIHYYGDVERDGPFTQYALVDVDDDGQPELWLKTADNIYTGVFTFDYDRAYIIGFSDRVRDMEFLHPGAVVTLGKSADFRHSWEYSVLEQSTYKYFINVDVEYSAEGGDFDPGDPTSIGMAYPFSETNRKDLNDEEIQEVLKSLGDAFTPQVVWKPFK